jgi:hypothetical protein
MVSRGSDGDGIRASMIPDLLRLRRVVAGL